MTLQTNIQKLFATLGLENVRSYLLNSGWQIKESQRADIVAFERQNAASGEIDRVWSYASETHPKFRRQLPNIIFTLAVVDKREPLDLANEMMASGGAGAAIECRATAERREGGERRETSPLAERTDESTERPDANAVELFQIVRWTDRGGATVSRNRIASGLVAAAGDARIEPLIQSLTGVWERVAFELEPSEQGQVPSENTTSRQAAIVAVVIARRLPASAGQAALVWRITLAVLGLGGLAMRWTTDAEEQLLATALADDEAAPRRTWHWLQARVRLAWSPVA